VVELGPPLELLQLETDPSPSPPSPNPAFEKDLETGLEKAPNAPGRFRTLAQESNELDEICEIALSRHKQATAQ
jgi:hypothetical protein